MSRFRCGLPALFGTCLFVLTVPGVHAHSKRADGTGGGGGGAQKKLIRQELVVDARGDSGGEDALPDDPAAGSLEDAAEDVATSTTGWCDPCWKYKWRSPKKNCGGWKCEAGRRQKEGGGGCTKCKDGRYYSKFEISVEFSCITRSASGEAARY